MSSPTVSARRFTHTTVIVVRGVVDEAGGDQLRHVLVDALMRNRTRRVVVDLARATELDPTAVGALIAAHETAPELSVGFSLRAPNRDIATELAGHGLLAIA